VTKNSDSGAPEKYGNSGRTLWRGAVLSNRDIAYLKLFARGDNSNARIARILACRVSTVWNASSKLKKKLGFSSRLEMGIEASKYLDKLT